MDRSSKGGGKDTSLVSPGRMELNRIRLDMRDGSSCDLVYYDVENYGHADYIEGLTCGNGDFRRARSLIPFEYMDARPEMFDWSLYGAADVSEIKHYANSIILRFAEFREKGLGLYIWSETRGSGKTFLSYCITGGIVDRTGVSAKFVTASEFLEMAKKKYKSLEEEEELNAIKEAGLLIVDDIGEESGRGSDAELFRLIDWRCTNKRVTIYTSGMPIGKLGLDARIVDRIYSTSFEARLPEVSVRRKIADGKKSAFFEDFEKNKKRPMD